MELLDWKQGRLPLSVVHRVAPLLQRSQRIIPYDKALVLAVTSVEMHWFFPDKFRPHRPHAVPYIRQAKEFSDVYLADSYATFWRRYLPPEVAVTLELLLTGRRIPQQIVQRRLP